MRTSSCKTGSRPQTSKAPRKLGRSYGQPDPKTKHTSPEVRNSFSQQEKKTTTGSEAGAHSCCSLSLEVVRGPKQQGNQKGVWRQNKNISNIFAWLRENCIPASLAITACVPHSAINHVYSLGISTVTISPGLVWKPYSNEISLCLCLVSHPPHRPPPGRTRGAKPPKGRTQLLPPLPSSLAEPSAWHLRDAQSLGPGCSAGSQGVVAWNSGGESKKLEAS